MSRPLPSNVNAWLTEPMPADVVQMIERLSRADDVRHLAIMPDVHLAHDVCVGTAIATETLIYPAAVGSDIGCGITMVAIDIGVSLRSRRVLDEILRAIGSAVPVNKHRKRDLPAMPADVTLSDERLETIWRRDGAVQFGTLGRGNHFLELQVDQHNQHWLMVHSGSRAVGPAIRSHHERIATKAASGLRTIDAGTPFSEAYASDVAAACAYARGSRRAMLDAAVRAIDDLLGCAVVPESYADCDHNHLRRESHFGKPFWIHRKGAMSASIDEPGAVPGSMGTESFHVRGRGHEPALRSTSHGAGRTMSREHARRKIRPSDLARQMRNVCFDPQAAAALREEAPSAYKDVRAVMRAQADLTKIDRTLRPLLVYKGG
jgi:tRNA-splicing ligase RtcB